MNSALRAMRLQTDPVLVVILAGVAAALHVGKLSPALPVLSDTLGLSLVQAGFLLSLVQMAGMLAGVAVGLTADGLGLKRCMLVGLVLLSCAGAAAGWAQDATSLLLLRALEGAGFLLACVPAPGLIRRHVAPQRMSAAFGLWGAYMPFGTAAALLIGPLVLEVSSWRVWYWALAGLSAGMAVWVWRLLPADPSKAAAPGRLRAPVVDTDAWASRLRRTVTSRGPWLVALSFALYSGQWLAVIGFLPSVYAQGGSSVLAAAAPLAFVALVNMVGNIVSGRLLQRGVAASVLLYVGFGAMALGALLAFADLGVHAQALDRGIRYTGVLVFSMVGGMIPGTLFSLAVVVAPDEASVSTTVGWMQQWSALGQFSGPPLVAWVAAMAGGWHWTWGVTGTCSILGLVVARQVARQVRP